MLTRRIFLASSNELKDDRIAFELMLGQLNQEWVPRGTFFHLVVWENFIDAMSQDGLQKEYNRAVAECDILVLLFCTKVGAYTAEEFEAAFGAFTSGKKPLIYTYFKDAVVLTGDIDDTILSLLEFKKRLSRLNHYYTRYRSSEELKWLFSRQLDKLFGDSQGLSFEVTDSTPQSQVDTVALALANKYLSEVDGRTTVDVSKLKRAIEKASELSRHTIFLLAQQIRRNHWATNKPLMERTIPIFEALLEADKTKHYYYAQLAYAQKDQVNPDWKGAKASLDRAFELLDAREVKYWPYYQLCRAACLIELDSNFCQGKASDKLAKKAILDDLHVARAGLHDYADMLNQPWNLSFRRWLSLNEQSPTRSL
jgi:hypothetical protein